MSSDETPPIVDGHWVVDGKRFPCLNCGRSEVHQVCAWVAPTPSQPTNTPALDKLINTVIRLNLSANETGDLLADLRATINEALEPGRVVRPPATEAEIDALKVNLQFNRDQW